jgi:NTP pyrophosphatase (non-canonical NTP hydrolase)
MTDRTPAVLGEVATERDRQDFVFGEQNHPLVDAGIMARLRPAHGGFEPSTANRREVAAALFREYELPDAGYARRMCQAAAQRGECTWAHILIEELCEFVEAPAERDVEAARAELVQLAAVAVAAVEYIDRQTLRAIEARGAELVRRYHPSLAGEVDD